MEGKIALEEHWESPDLSATGTHNFTDTQYFEAVQKRLQEFDKRIQDMNKNGIQTSILSLTQPGIEGITDPERAIKLAKQMNDYIAEHALAKYPDRFKAFAALPLQDSKAAGDELERAVNELGFSGALMNGYSNIGDENTAQYLDEPQVWPFWERVEKLGVPVYLHPRIPLPHQQRIYEGYKGLLGSAWGFGVETAMHAIRLILSGLFDRYPNLTIILGHLGEGLPFTLPRVGHRLRHQRPETHGNHKKAPMEYLRNNFYLTTSGVFRTQALLDTLLEVGADRILFSVDYPYESMEEISSWFDSCPISENDRLKIGSENAKKLFHLDSVKVEK